MSERAYTCGLHLPGHDVHWVQAKLSVKERSQRPLQPGRLLEVQPDGLVVVGVGGSVRRLWSHDTDRLKELVARNRGDISHQPGFDLLHSTSAEGSYLFCVADADSPNLRACPTDPPAGSFVELLREAGVLNTLPESFLLDERNVIWKACSRCGGDVVATVVAPIERWVGFSIAGSVASVCSLCGHFRACDKCGGRVLWEWHSPDQAFWVCRDCKDTAIACSDDSPLPSYTARPVARELPKLPVCRYCGGRHSQHGPPGARCQVYQRVGVRPRRVPAWQPGFTPDLWRLQSSQLREIVELRDQPDFVRAAIDDVLPLKDAAEELLKLERSYYRLKQAVAASLLPPRPPRVPERRKLDLEAPIGTAFLLLWPLGVVILLPISPLAAIGLFILYLMLAGLWFGR